MSMLWHSTAGHEEKSRRHGRHNIELGGSGGCHPRKRLLHCKCCLIYSVNSTPDQLFSGPIFTASLVVAELGRGGGCDPRKRLWCCKCCLRGTLFGKNSSLAAAADDDDDDDGDGDDDDDDDDDDDGGDNNSYDYDNFDYDDGDDDCVHWKI